MIAPPSAADAPVSRTRVFAPLDHYLPGYRAGGPIQSISNLVEVLGTEIEFSIATRDRDLGSRHAYPGPVADGWHRVGKAHVRYLAPGHVLKGLYRLTTKGTYDVLYLNSAFSPYFSVFPLFLRKVGLVHPAAVIVAPRGEFSPGALALKRRKKRLFLAFAKRVGLYEEVSWQASAILEVQQVAHVIGAVAANEGRLLEAPSIIIAPDLISPRGRGGHRPKVPGSARIVFLSRIARMKNLSRVIELLGHLDGRVSLDIYGPVEDARYWRECRARIASLPANIRVTYCGEVAHERVPHVLGSYHLLLLPTFGENFGHVVHEALSAGCLVGVSDLTPWRGLSEAAAGWDLPLDDELAWRHNLTALVDADEDRFGEMSHAATVFAARAAESAQGVEANRRLFVTVLGRQS